jgi:hypothetical protein
MSWTKYTGIPCETLADQTGVAVAHQVATLIACTGVSACTSAG